MLALQALVVPAESEIGEREGKCKHTSQRTTMLKQCAEKAANAHTVSGVHFESMQAFHVTPHYHHIAAGVFIHPLNDLEVQVCVVQIVLVDCKSPRFGKTTYHSHSCCPIHCTTLNLDDINSKKRTITNAMKIGLYYLQFYLL